MYKLYTNHYPENWGIGFETNRLANPKIMFIGKIDPKDILLACNKPKRHSPQIMLRFAENKWIVCLEIYEDDQVILEREWEIKYTEMRQLIVSLLADKTIALYNVMGSLV